MGERDEMLVSACKEQVNSDERRQQGEGHCMERKKLEGSRASRSRMDVFVG